MFKYYTGAKVDAVEKRYKIAIKNEEKNSFEYKRLKVCMHAEKQFVMTEEKDVLVFYYNEAMVQFGYIVLFS